MQVSFNSKPYLVSVDIHACPARRVEAGKKRQFQCRPSSFACFFAYECTTSTTVIFYLCSITASTTVLVWHLLNSLRLALRQLFSTVFWHIIRCSLKYMPFRIFQIKTYITERHSFSRQSVAACSQWQKLRKRSWGTDTNITDEMFLSAT